MSVGTQARDSGTHINHVRRVIIDYYSQGHWIKLLSFPRDKLRGAGCFPVGLSETFYAAFSKNYQERISRRNVRPQRPADSETAIPSKHSQNSDMRETQMQRGAWARFSGTRGCGFKTGVLDTGAYHVGFTLGISGCETFFTCDMRKASGFGEACRLDVVGLRRAPKRLPRAFHLPHPPL